MVEGGRGVGGGGGGGGSITNDVLKFRKVIEFQSSWTVNELCTCIRRVPSSCPVIADIYGWTLWKNHLCEVFSSKKKKKKKKKKKIDKTTEIRNIKL